MTRLVPFVGALSIAASVGVGTMAQEPSPPQPQDTPAQTPGQTPGPPGRGGAAQDPRPYEQVITKEAKSDTGVFTVHRIRDRVYYEIPASELGKEFLWVSQIARNTLGAGTGGQAVSDRVVKWERLNNRVLL
jgi:hypothetical protein